MLFGLPWKCYEPPPKNTFIKALFTLVLDGIKQAIEAISPFTVHRIHSHLFERMFDGLLNCLSKHVRGQRLDHRGFLGFMAEYRRSWDDLDYIGSVVSTKESEEPLAFAIATKRRYLEGIPDRAELDTGKTRAFTELENWSLKYVSRKDECKGQHPTWRIVKSQIVL